MRDDMRQQWEQLCCRGTVLPALASKVGQTRGKAFRRALLVQNPTRQPTKITICLSFEERRIPGQADQDDQACQATAHSYTTAQEKTLVRKYYHVFSYIVSYIFKI